MINHSMDETQGYTTLQSILLHLFPGVIATAVFVLTAPLATAMGYPSITALYLPMILTVILLELGYLLSQGRKRNGTLSLNGIVNFREPVPWWQYVVFPILIVTWGIIVTVLVSPIDNLILTRFFAWLPDWFALRSLLEIPNTFPRETLLMTAFFAVILSGHLLPRMSRFGRWAPLSTLCSSRSITSGRHGCFYHAWRCWCRWSIWSGASVTSTSA